MRVLGIASLVVLACLAQSTDVSREEPAVEPGTRTPILDHDVRDDAPEGRRENPSEDQDFASQGTKSSPLVPNDVGTPEPVDDTADQDYEDGVRVDVVEEGRNAADDVFQADMAVAEDRIGYAPPHPQKAVPMHGPVHGTTHMQAHVQAHVPARVPAQALMYVPNAPNKGSHGPQGGTTRVRVRPPRPRPRKMTPEEKRLLPVRCNKNQRYRTYDGSCNNLYHACWGRAGESYGRLLKPLYSDGRGHPRSGEYGRQLPNSRLLSLVLTGEGYQTSDTTYPHNTDMLTHFGQLLAHDVTFAAEYTDEVMENGALKKQAPSCCKEGRSNTDGCSPIMVYHSDDFYPAGHCIEMVRSAYYNASRTSCSKNSPGLYREQVNQVTSFIDGSSMYGSSYEDSKRLRSNNGKGAKMEVDKSSLYIPKGLLPRMPDGECFSYMPGCDRQCFHTGDKRASLTPMIASLQTLFIREHNHIADELKKKGWPDEKIYQVVRKIVGACMHVIAYKEYLPLVLGPRIMDAYRLSIPTPSYYYNHTLNPSLLNEFATGANRLPHAAVGSKFHREGQKCYHTSRVSYDLNTMDDFCKPKTDPVRSLLMGASGNKMQQQGTLYSKEITRYLFASPPNQYGKDLLALDISRGRDHGLPPYGYFRKLCGLPPVYTFDEFKKESKSYDIVNRLKAVYGNYFEDLDLAVGLIMEKPVPGALYGPTTVCIMAEQFYRLKYGDRFWFENLYHPGSFNKEQLRDITKITLATLICKNTDVEHIQPNVFMMPGTGNQKQSCKSIIAQTDYSYSLYK